MHPLTSLAAAGPADGVLLPVLALLWWLPYRARVRVLAKERRAVPGWRQACFASGLIVLAVALSPPVDTLADQLLVAHMAEHLLIGDIASLLLVLGLHGPAARAGAAQSLAGAPAGAHASRSSRSRHGS